jgi:phosphoribosylaminoimidazole (AIR) synthetase
MFRAFNAGIGMAVVCAPGEAGGIKAALEGAGEDVYEIGKTVDRSDDDEPVRIENGDALWHG